MQCYTGRRKRLGSASASTESELPLACTEQWLPRHSGNFSPVMLLKGYFFFLSNPVLGRTASPGRRVTTSHRSPQDRVTKRQQTPRRGPGPRRQHQRRAAPPTPSLPAQPCRLCSCLNLHPPSETSTQFLCTTNKLRSCQHGTRKGHPSGPPAPLLWQTKARQSASLTCGGKGGSKSSPRGAGRHREWMWPRLHARAARPS